MDAFALEFQNRARGHRLWRHPFFRQRSLPFLRSWAIQAGKIDEAFAGILTSMLENPALPSHMQPPIEENLADELGHGNPQREHFTLFIHVLSSLGISLEEYRRTPANESTRAIIEQLNFAAADQDILPVLALMANEELICPREFGLLVAQLRVHGITRLDYFDEHIQADVGHSNDLIRLCAQAANGNPQRIATALSWQQVDLENNTAFYDELLTYA